MAGGVKVKEMAGKKIAELLDLYKQYVDDFLAAQMEDEPLPGGRQ